MTRSEDEHTGRLLYQAYMVRLWQETHATPCRASAQSVQSGETVHFSTLRALYAFLDAQVGAAQPTRADEDRADNT